VDSPARRWRLWCIGYLLVSGGGAPLRPVGTLPPRVLGQVFEWAALHQEELLADWAQVAAHQMPAPIPPLA